MSMSRFDWDDTEKQVDSVMERMDHLIQDGASFCRSLEDKCDYMDKKDDRLRALRRSFHAMNKEAEKLKKELADVKDKVDAEVIPDTKMPPNGWW